MQDSSIGARIYFFACCFLWSTLTLFHYLDEEMAQVRIGHLHSGWSKLFSSLVNWTLEERFFPVVSQEIKVDEKDKVFSIADRLGDSLIFRWGDSLELAAINSHTKHPNVSQSMWLYYYYCLFLGQVLTEFDRLLRAVDSSPIYYERYRQSIRLFDDVAAALEHERFVLESKAHFNEKTKEKVWHEMNAYVAKLGAEWQQAVHSAAHTLKRPDLNDS